MFFAKTSIFQTGGQKFVHFTSSEFTFLLLKIIVVDVLHLLNRYSQTKINKNKLGNFCRKAMYSETVQYTWLKEKLVFLVGAFG